MVRLVMAEDQTIEREGLLRNIAWDALGIEVVGAAEDGEQAWALVERQRPDILMTDIVMPILNGIELANRVSETFPHVKIIFFSGHDDFHFARAAIKARVCEYILKPYAIEEVTQTLRKTADLCLRDNAERDKETRLRTELERSKPLLERHCLRESLLGLSADGEPDAERGNDGSDGNDAGGGRIGGNLGGVLPERGQYALLLLKLDDLPDAAGRRRFDLALDAYVHTLPGAMTTQLAESEYAVVIGSAAGQPLDRRETRQAASLLRRHFGERGMDAFTVCISDAVDSAERLKDAYAQAAEALRYRLLVGSDKIISAGEVGAAEDELATYTPRTDKIAQRVKALIHARYMEDITLNDIAGEVYVSHNHLNSLFKRATGKNINKYLIDVRIAKAMELLAQPDAVIQRVSEKVGYKNVSHFSTLFRKHTGMSPMEFRENGGKKQN